MKRIFILFNIIVILSGCKGLTDGQYNITGAFKSYGYFKKGSYWVYRDERDQKRDSVWLGPDEQNFYDPDSPPAMQLISLDVRNGFYSTWYMHRMPDDRCVLTIDLKTPLPYRSEALSQWVSGGFLDSISATCRLVQIHPTMNVNGLSFSNVIQTRDSIRIKSSDFVVNFYFEKSVGLVRCDIRNGDSTYAWSLLKYDVTP